MEFRIVAWEKNQRAFIFGGYCDTLEAYLELAAQAKKDFPGVTDKDLILSKVRGNSYMQGKICISFTVESSHPNYPVWDKFDFTY